MFPSILSLRPQMFHRNCLRLDQLPIRLQLEQLEAYGHWQQPGLLIAQRHVVETILGHLLDGGKIDA